MIDWPQLASGLAFGVVVGWSFLTICREIRGYRRQRARQAATYAARRALWGGRPPLPPDPRAVVESVYPATIESVRLHRAVSEGEAEELKRRFLDAQRGGVIRVYRDEHGCY